MVETMTTEQVAELLKVTPATVYRWVREGELSAHRIGRTLRFSRNEVERLVNGSAPTTTLTRTDDPLTDLVTQLADQVEAELRRRGVLSDNGNGRV